MLSKDELANGKLFLLRLWDQNGVASQWAETLRGDAASHWYSIYRFSNWPALRAEATGVFRTAATEDEAAAILKSGQCVYIHTREVAADELAVAPGVH